MPNLQITRAALNPAHAMATTNHLLSVMLWPTSDQVEKRAEFMRTCDAVQVAEQARALPGTMRPEMMEQMLLARRPADFEEEIILRSQEGMLVGEYYAETIARHMVGDPIRVRDMLDHMTMPEVQALHPVRNRGRSKLKDLIAEYRPAALLLAASYIRHHFPADLSVYEVDKFLAVTEWVRVRAASIVSSPHRPEPLLALDRDVWRVPPYLKLPTVSLPLSPALPLEWFGGSLRKRA